MNIKNIIDGAAECGSAFIVIIVLLIRSVFDPVVLFGIAAIFYLIHSTGY